MEHVYANKTVGISELKANPSAVLSAAQGEPIEPIRTGSANLCGRPAHIVVAEDLEVNRDLVRILLSRAGHRVDVVANGAEAVAAVAAGAYDLVLMDVQMPQVDGLEATKRIRALPSPHGQIPIIALTANAFASEIQACLDAGMTDHLVKPIDVDKLLGAVDRAVQPERASPSPAKLRPPAEAPPTQLPPALMEKFVAQLGAAAADIDAALALGEAAAIIDGCHKLSGVSAVFGYPDLAEAAHTLEMRLVQEGLSDDARDLAALFAARLHDTAKRLGHAAIGTPITAG